MVTSRKLKALGLLLVSLLLISVKALFALLQTLWHYLVSFVLYIDDSFERDDDEPLIGSYYNYRTGEIDSIKRYDGIYDENP